MIKSAILLTLSFSLLACNLQAVNSSDEAGAENTRQFRQLPTDAQVEQFNAQVKPDERIVCRQETKVGTNIPKRVCRYVRDIEEASAFHREQLQRVLR